MNAQVLRTLAKIEDDLRVEVVFASVISGEAYGYKTSEEIPEVFFAFKYDLSVYLSVLGPEMVLEKRLDSEEGRGIIYTGIELREFLKALHASEFFPLRVLRSSMVISDTGEVIDSLLEYSSKFINRLNFQKSGIRTLRDTGEIRNIRVAVELSDFIYNLHIRLMVRDSLLHQGVPWGDFPSLVLKVCSESLELKEYEKRMEVFLRTLRDFGSWPWIPDELDLLFISKIESVFLTSPESVINPEVAKDEINYLFKEIVG